MRILSTLTVKSEFLSCISMKFCIPLKVRIIATSLPTLNTASMAALPPICPSLKKTTGESLQIRSMVTALPLPYLATRPGSRPSRTSVLRIIGMFFGMISYVIVYVIFPDSYKTFMNESAVYVLTLAWTFPLVEGSTWRSTIAVEGVE
jgi:hypothetical protein